MRALLILMVFVWSLPAGARRPPRVFPRHGLHKEYRPRPVIRVPYGTGPAFDYLAVDQEVTLDPDAGVASATVSVAVRSVSPSSTAFYLLIDEGLAFTVAEAPGYTVTVNESSWSPFNYATVNVSPPVPVGEEVTFTFGYSGTLQCNPYGARGSRFCGVGAELDHFLDGSVFPLLMDSLDPYGLDVFSRSLALHTPSGPAAQDALVSADFVSEADDGTTRTTVWQADEFSSAMSFIAVTGDFTRVEVPDTVPQFYVAHLTSSTAWVTDMVEWMGRIVAFLDDQAGMVFPFKQVNVVKLPWIEGFPGTATHSMVYLSEVYGQSSAEEFEETLAHENSHLWWGVLVNPVDDSQWLIEGPAVFSQYDYTAAVHYSHLDRDEYLAGRYHHNTLLLRYLTDWETLPHLVLPAGEDMPDTVNEQVTWAYFKSSATLDYLRVILGEEAFAEGLKAYAADCLLTACDSQDFRAAMEAASGEDLQQFLEQWVYSTNYPVVTLGFTQEYQENTGVWRTELTLDQPHLDRALTYLPLALQIRLSDGKVQTRRVDLESQNGSFVFQLPAAAVSIRPNPRQDTVVWSRSAQEGDVNFDMEVDGLDLIRWAFREGRVPVTSANPSIYDVDLDFDPRCDFNDDRVIDQTDLDVILTAFGTLRSP